MSDDRINLSLSDLISLAFKWTIAKIIAWLVLGCLLGFVAFAALLTLSVLGVML